jgi:hypothetical protein
MNERLWKDTLVEGPTWEKLATAEYPSDDVRLLVAKYKAEADADRLRDDEWRSSPLSAREQDVVAASRHHLRKMRGAAAPGDFTIDAAMAKLWLETIAHLAARTGE